VKLSTALSLGRVSNLPTVASNVLTGVALSGADAPGARNVAGWMCAMAAFYTGGMYLNDAFDRGWDAQHRPERPIPAGAASASVVFACGFGMLALGLAMSFGVAGGWAGHGLRAGIAALALGGCIVLYDAHHKQNPWAPLLMGLCRVLIYVSVALGLGAVWDVRASLSALALLGYLMGLTYVARQENLSELTNMWPLLLLSAPFVIAFPRALDLHLLVYLLLAGWVAYSLRFLVVERGRSIPGAVARLIAGIALVDAVLVTDARAIALCVAAWVATRLLHRVVAGT
jgi:4-hydroxybenzoate polyprenyltransferase